MTIQRMSPQQAFTALQSNGQAILIDVRDPVEFAFVGHPPTAVNIPWKYAPNMRDNPDFLTFLGALVPALDTPLYLMCRSGQRSLAAATALNGAGYTDLTNIEEGFEGAIDDDKHRGTLGGWRFHGLPWIQS